MATTPLTSADRLMLEGLYWWDIATFLRSMEPFYHFQRRASSYRSMMHEQKR